MKNIHYETSEISSYFSENRVTWDQFYPSEKKLFDSLNLQAEQTVLDVGCGCGGLGIALNERYAISSYTGIDINNEAIKTGKEMSPSFNFIAGDILDATGNILSGRRFDLVCSLSCVDWNVQFTDMLAAAWSHVKPGGKFVATFRLSIGEGSSDLKDTYQYINYEGKKEGEIAAYVVLNFNSLMRDLLKLRPSTIKGTGYWGKPGPSAVTPYDKLCFVAFSITKRNEGETGDTNIDLDLPDDILESLEV